MNDLQDRWDDDPRRVIVGVGELACAEHPAVLITQALGSCVGLALWDPMTRIGGLAHIMLPTVSGTAKAADPARFASSAVPLLVDRLTGMGAPKRRIVARLAGGAAMFGGEAGLGAIGRRNTAEVKSQLERLGIPIRGEDTGGSHARTIELHLDTGILLVRSYAFGLKEI